ncbi:hypothetical protein ACFE04_012678 [Oxalis oulophora]
MSPDCTSPPSLEVVRDRNETDLASDGLKFHFGGKFNFNEVYNTVEFVGGEVVGVLSIYFKKPNVSLDMDLHLFENNEDVVALVASWIEDGEVEVFVELTDKSVSLFIQPDCVVDDVGDGGIKDKDNSVGDDAEFDKMMKMVTTHMKVEATDQTVGGESDDNYSIETTYMEDPNYNCSMDDEEDIVSQKNVGASGNGSVGGNNTDGGDGGNNADGGVNDGSSSEEMHSEHIRRESNKIYYDIDNPKLCLKMIFTDRKQFKEAVIEDSIVNYTPFKWVRNESKATPILNLDDLGKFVDEQLSLEISGMKASRTRAACRKKLRRDFMSTGARNTLEMNFKVSTIKDELDETMSLFDIKKKNEKKLRKTEKWYHTITPRIRNQLDNYKDKTRNCKGLGFVGHTLQASYSHHSSKGKKMGRPRVKRIREDGEGTSTKVSRKGGIMRCGFCRKIGHKQNAFPSKQKKLKKLEELKAVADLDLLRNDVVKIERYGTWLANQSQTQSWLTIGFNDAAWITKKRSARKNVNKEKKRVSGDGEGTSMKQPSSETDRVSELINGALCKLQREQFEPAFVD